MKINFFLQLPLDYTQFLILRSIEIMLYSRFTHIILLSMLNHLGFTSTIKDLSGDWNHLIRSSEEHGIDAILLMYNGPINLKDSLYVHYCLSLHLTQTFSSIPTQDRPLIADKFWQKTLKPQSDYRISIGLEIRLHKHIHIHKGMWTMIEVKWSHVLFTLFFNSHIFISSYKQFLSFFGPTL